MKTEITFEKLFELVPVVNNWFATTPFAPKTKLGYALIKFTKKIQPQMDLYESERENANIDFCLTGEDKGILYEITKDAKGGEIKSYKYTPENKKKLLKRHAEIKSDWMNKKIEVESYFATELPDGLTEEQTDVFRGIVIDPEHEIYR